MKSLSFSIKFLLLTFIFGLMIFYILPVDEFGAKCGSKSFVPLIIIILMVFLPLIVAIIEKIKKKISIITFIMILIVSILIFLVIGFSLLEGNRCAPDWKATISNMHQLYNAQQIFYEENNKYAETQEELIEAGIFVGKAKNKTTNKEFVDKDGEGIEGGDDNSQTWSARTYIQYKEFNIWCMQKNKEYFYICNQNGCQKEY